MDGMKGSQGELISERTACFAGDWPYLCLVYLVIKGEKGLRIFLNYVH